MNKRGHLWIGILAGIAVTISAPAFAKKCKDGEPSHVASFKVVAGSNMPFAINEPLAGKKGNAADAVKWMAHRRLGNCLACHKVSKILEMAKKTPKIVVAVKKNGKKVKMPLGDHGKIGPPLDGIGGRYSAGELRMLIVNPKRDFPDTIMPAFHVNKGFIRVPKACQGKAILNEQQIEDIVAFLGTLK